MRFRWWGGVGATLLATLMALSACAGDRGVGEAVERPVEVTRSWVSGANDACREGRVEIESVLGTPAAISGAEGTDPIAAQRVINRIGVQVATQLRALPLPVGDERRATELIDLFEATNEVNAAALDAALRDDDSALDALVPEFTRLSGRFHDAALALDVRECIRRPFDPEPGPRL